MTVLDQNPGYEEVMFFIDIKEYMARSKEERQSHLALSEPCIEIGGRSDQFRGMLAHYLKTTIPSGMKIHLCHSCNNGACSNPKHLYWGTAKENINDAIVAGSMEEARINNSIIQIRLFAERKTKYEKNPKLCVWCKGPLKYEQVTGHNYETCSRTCGCKLRWFRQRRVGSEATAPVS